MRLAYRSQSLCPFSRLFSFHCPQPFIPSYSRSPFETISSKTPFLGKLAKGAKYAQKQTIGTRTMPGSSKSLAVSMTVTGTVSYFIRSRVEHILTGVDPVPFTTPVVVVHAESPGLVSVSQVEKALGRLDTIDDVYSPEFAVEGFLILIYDTDEPPKVDDDLTTYLKRSFAGNCISQKAETKASWLEGPYFLQGVELHQAWRLYPDYLSAFASAMIPDETSPYSFHPLNSMAYDGLHPVIAVPSRLYFPISAEKPLNGMRIAVKDNYHIAGMVTTHGNRSFAKCYGTQRETSEFVKQLIERGAIIVGKTKLSSFAGNEVPPNGPVDYLAPFNPRADGYQNPLGSSMGSAVAVAGYDWIDGSLATDTTGSTRAPAAGNGVWALRTSWASMPMAGIIPSVKTFDTVGLISRSPDGLLRLLAPSVKDLEEEPLPTRLLYPIDWLPTGNDGQQQMIDAMTTRLEDILGVTRTEISLSQKWTETAPDHLRSTSLVDFLRKSGFWINMYDGYHNFAEFRALHKQKFDEPPYISPVQTKKWKTGSGITPEQRAEAVAQVAIFKDWVSRNVIGEDSASIMIVAVGSPGPNYRDEVPPPAPKAPGISGGSYNANFFTTILGLPQVIVPIGQLPFDSRVSERVEYAPVVAGLIGAVGTDGLLVRVARDALERGGWQTEVHTGRFTFSVGENERHAANLVTETARI